MNWIDLPCMEGDVEFVFSLVLGNKVIFVEILSTPEFNKISHRLGLCD